MRPHIRRQFGGKSRKTRLGVARKWYALSENGDSYAGFERASYPSRQRENSAVVDQALEVACHLSGLQDFGLVTCRPRGEHSKARARFKRSKRHNLSAHNRWLQNLRARNVFQCRIDRSSDSMGAAEASCFNRARDGNCWGLVNPSCTKSFELSKRPYDGSPRFTFFTWEEGQGLTACLIPGQLQATFRRAQQCGPNTWGAL
jgi:hypothetical protein